MEAVGEFFRTLPQVFVALWEFGGEWSGVLIMGVSVLLTVVFLAGAHVLRDRSGWLSAILGMMAGTIAMWWVFGIIPSAWVYFADTERDLLIDRIIPSALFPPLFGNFYQVFRDTVVVVMMTVGLVGTVVLALWIQRRYPRALAEGEEARPQSGGYK